METVETEHVDTEVDENLQHARIDVDSNTPSVALEDVEGSSDDDIFLDRNLNRRDLIQKLKKMILKSRKVPAQPQVAPTIADEDWYSDLDDEDDLISLSSSDDEAQRHPYYKNGVDKKDFKMFVGLMFANAKKFREVLIDWSIRQGFELQWIRNDNYRITAKCNDEGCTWRIHASPVQKETTFQVKTITGEHTCARKNTNKLANAKYLASRMENTIRENPDISISRLQNIIKRKCNLEVGKWKAIRAKNLAIRMIRGKEGLQYEKLWDYCETVRRNNPGSTILLKRKEDSDPPVFDKMYFSLDAMIKGFLAGCRPIIGLDGCFLKTVYKGHLLVAIGRDGNDNMWPIALAVVQFESKETWTWFVNQLLEDIGGLGRIWWTFISDRQKGLIEALKDLVPDCEHRFCVRHMYDNFKKKFKDKEELKPLFWRAASAANKSDFELYMKEIEKADQKKSEKIDTAAEWLNKIPKQHWSRAFFSTHCKSDTLVNNICESFNSYILEARDKPIITMWEWIREKLMTRIQSKREGMEKYTGVICPNIMKKLNKQNELARYCYPKLCGNNEYQVDHNLDKYIVHLNEKTCTCGMFQLTKYPCCHAYAAISHQRYKLEDFVDDCFKRPLYMKVYEHMIHGVPGHKHLIGNEPLKPPKLESKRGRPKKLRRKGPGEIPRGTSTRKGLTQTCRNCLQKGHNRGSCKNPTHPNSKFNKANSTIYVEEPNQPDPHPTDPHAQTSNTTMNQGATSISDPAQSIPQPTQPQSQTLEISSATGFASVSDPIQPGLPPTKPQPQTSVRLRTTIISTVLDPIQTSSQPSKSHSETLSVDEKSQGVLGGSQDGAGDNQCVLKQKSGRKKQVATGSQGAEATTSTCVAIEKAKSKRKKRLSEVMNNLREISRKRRPKN